MDIPSSECVCGGEGERGGGKLGCLSHKINGGARPKFGTQFLRGTKIPFCGRGLKCFTPTWF